MRYEIATVGQIVGGQWLQCPSPDQLITQLLVDSRQLQDPAHTLFFALQGLRRDGHQFISRLYEEGVRAFVVQYPVDLEPLADANIIVVDEVVKALQHLVSYHRSQFRFPVVAITGSNGKTVVKEWLYQLLSVEFQIVKSPKSYNSQIGVPLSVWQLHSQAD
ncbi:MAG: hypothetical protein KDC80_08570, partial [Saprospiraceae bacterium]|nr:hypothetical protein [Saprospiraceae bacterium]